MSPTVDELIAEFRNVDPSAPDKQWQAAIELGKLSDRPDRAKAVSALMTAMGDLHFDALARSHAAEYGGDPLTLIVFGHWGGAHAGAMVTFNRPAPSADCLGGTTSICSGRSIA